MSVRQNVFRQSVFRQNVRPPLFNFFSRSFDQDTRVEKLSYKLSLVNSHQLLCNSCSRLTRTWELRKLLYKLSLVNSHQLSCNSCSRLTRTWELRKLSNKLSPVNSQSTKKLCSTTKVIFLVLTWLFQFLWLYQSFRVCQESQAKCPRFASLFQRAFEKENIPN